MLLEKNLNDDQDLICRTGMEILHKNKESANTRSY